MKKSLMISLMVVALVCVFALPAVIAGNAAPDQITITAPEGVKATKTPVDFPHKMHADSGIDCLVCHHKDESKDAVKSCAAEGCHVDASKAAKKKPEGFYQAFHNKKSKTSCLGCHKAEKKAGNKKAPVSCKACHPKK
ncbi:cytochrome C [Pseudodesulfovibrio sp. JC047]|uniref:cytochrome c3 family protein n=1 Tax=Pseudodesulfovibrio sp. JC047 TaxID=2683199 RepID=UPI0013D5D6F7|nr:cytochrome c3 family protein [Pseudodesulfovibrio sp. JC047]NDV19676.1 cytochrome C [Pseudodesulfovibrio sp. JC047]